jgi:hypothetical protein
MEDFVMRSYETARSLFSFLALIAWAVVVIGVLVALISAAGVSKYAGGGAGLLAMVPGIGIVIAGLLQIAFVQMGRATVDTAEYTQQMLKVARDQLDVSRQALKQQDINVHSFTSLQQHVSQEGGQQSYSESRPVQHISESKAPDEVIEYAGHQIERFGEIFALGAVQFHNLGYAKDHVDLVLNKALVAESQLPNSENGTTEKNPNYRLSSATRNS